MALLILLVLDALPETEIFGEVGKEPNGDAPLETELYVEMKKEPDDPVTSHWSTAATGTNESDQSLKEPSHLKGNSNSPSKMSFILR